MHYVCLNRKHSVDFISAHTKAPPRETLNIEVWITLCSVDKLRKQWCRLMWHIKRNKKIYDMQIILCMV